MRRFVPQTEERILVYICHVIPEFRPVLNFRVKSRVKQQAVSCEEPIVEL